MGLRSCISIAVLRSGCESPSSDLGKWEASHFGLFNPASPGIKVTIQNCPSKGHHLRPKAGQASEELQARPTADFDFRNPLEDQTPRHLAPYANRVKSVSSLGSDVGDPGHQPGAIP